MELSEEHVQTSPGGQNSDSPQIPSEQRHIQWSAWTVLRAVWVLSLNLYVIIGFLFNMLLLFPVRLYSRELYYKMEGWISHWGNACLSSGMLSAGYTVSEAGDDITKCTDDVTLFLVNHQTPLDILVMTSATLDKGKIRLGIMWMILKLFKWTHIGVSCQFRQDFFISQGRAGRDKTLQQLKVHLKTNFISLPNKKGMIVYPEGGFLSNCKDASDRYAKKNDLPGFKNVTYPRAGATKIILDTFGAPECPPQRKLKWVVDVTIGYADGEPLSPKSLIFADRSPFKTVLYYRLWSVDDIPTEEEELTSWLCQRWSHKEKLLEEFYKSGSYPACRDEITKTCVRNEDQATVINATNGGDIQTATRRAISKPIYYDTAWLYVVNVIYILTFVLECKMLFWMIGFVMGTIF